MDRLYELFQPFGAGMTASVISQMILRLVVASLLGGIIGLEREIKRKPAGLRTNLFICFGSAFFTILSDAFAEKWGGDHTRIAAQIIPGIGFIGAGSILHSRGSITGVTTAATIFVVASIGMAVGGGLFLPAIFATVVIVLSLMSLGWIEGRFNLKAVSMAYEVLGHDAEAAVAAVNETLREQQQAMKTVQIARSEHGFRLVFTVEAPQKMQDEICRRLRQYSDLRRVECLGSTTDRD
ncbi:MAG TPA: MgtC/SapB family protein [Terriglobales bacterium]|nr:MgtC/SapB family protein [Terriglobales bacterium]